MDTFALWIGWSVIFVGSFTLSMLIICFCIYWSWYYLQVLALQLFSLKWRIQHGKGPEEK